MKYLKRQQNVSKVKGLTITHRSYKALEIAWKANNKAKHSYLQELINQCTNYLAGKPIKLDYKKKITNRDKELIDDELYRNNNSVNYRSRRI